MEPWLLSLIGWAVTALAMAGLWFLQRRTGNAGWVDVAWTFAIGIGGVAHAALGDGWLPRRILVGTLIGLWSLRLGCHLWQRVASEAEDGRYANLREKLGSGSDRWFFVFFQAQGLLAVLLCLPIAVVAASQVPSFRIWDGLAVALFAISWVGEAIADRQLKAWKQNELNRGRTCRRGLWRYSRHPNYFFEWLHWLVYPVMAVGMAFAPWLWLAPLSMWILIRYVTGIPPTEEQSVRSRGEDYRQYQRTTNAFFPGPVRTQSRTVANHENSHPMG